MAEKETDQVRDTEFTLSTSKLLGIFFALVIICGVFFTMGYMLGKSTSAGGRTEIVATVPSGNAAGKPSAANKTPEAAPSPAATNGDASAAGKNPDQPAAQQASGKTPDPSNPQPTGEEVKNGAGSSYMVQVAAVSKSEDAEILVTSLRKKQYPVFIANAPGDPLFHVQVGPFSDKKDADAMRTRLAGDGYNAIVK
ncbi:MAG TPA: SPOR domain-containing protein [Candidatus Angelobacter sp.]|jgi:cell division septation protein DedD